MGRHRELVFDFAVTAQTELRFTDLEQLNGREAGLLRIRARDEHVRARDISAGDLAVGGMTVSATDVVAPVFAAAEVVVLFSSRVAAQAGFGDLFRRFVLERNDLGRIAFLHVGLAWSMTGFAPGHFLFPTLQAAKFCV